MEQEIKFEYKTKDLGILEIIAGSDGKGIIVIDKLTDEEVDIEDLSVEEQIEVHEQVFDWVNYFKDMKEMCKDSHPANDQFGSEYIRGLNKDMGKE